MTFFNLMVSLRRNYETEKVVFLNYAAKHFSHNEVFFAQMHKPVLCLLTRIKEVKIS